MHISAQEESFNNKVKRINTPCFNKRAAAIPINPNNYS